MAAKKAPKKPAARKPKTPAEAELKPHKIVGQLVGARFNEHGEIVGEEVMGDVMIFKANFGKVAETVEVALEQAREQEALARGTAPEIAG